jgi:hypothetical protein
VIVSSPAFPDSPTVIAARERARLAAESKRTADAATDFSDRLLRTFLGLCENPRTRQRMLRMVKSSVGKGGADRTLYRMLNRTVVTPTAKATGIEASALRYELVCGQLVGLAMMRYVLQVEPVASTSTDEIVRALSPAIRATLKG